MGIMRGEDDNWSMQFVCPQRLWGNSAPDSLVPWQIRGECDFRSSYDALRRIGRFVIIRKNFRQSLDGVLAVRIVEPLGSM